MPALESILELLAGPLDPLSRDSFEPGHLTVGAFAVAEGQVLMVHHRRLGIWIEPGGHIDPEDVSLETAAARELLEETGVDATLVDEGIFDIDAHDIPAARSEPAHRHFNVSYLFEAEPSPVVAAAEVLDAAWIPFERVGEFTTDSAVLRAVAKLSARYRR